LGFSVLHFEIANTQAQMASARIIRYRGAGVDLTLGVDEAGSGSSVVLLPALSSISTRAEMGPLLERLAPQFRVFSVDWPGFGALTRERADWSPRILSGFLHWLLSEIVPPPHSVVAAGHAATYALYQSVQRPGTIDRMVLIGPTWRGPLPTMMGGKRAWFAWVRAAVDHGGIGPLLYRINVSRMVIAKMAREHVYDDPGWLSGDRLAAKLDVTRAAGARHASVRFVSGALDRVDSRAAFLDLARRAMVPILVVYGDRTPPRSRAEIQELAELPNVRMERLTTGKLLIHEEFPDAVARAVLPFLGAR
jgi:pimeloyl-ACP methyl ester carboxylesterase